jgi:DNA-binding CsgD family transcriptional regulator/tetratricopeptide (TPR) repeat protein
VPSGQADWVRELATRALSVTTEPVTRIMAQLHIGWSLVWSDRHAEALAALIPVAIEACDRLPAVAWGALGLAGTVAYQTGTPASRAAVLGALDRMTEPPAMTPGQASLYRLWVQVSSDPFGARVVRVPSLHVLADGPVSDLGTLGAAAWLLDETETAVRLLREALSQLRAPGMRGRSGAVLTALEWACVDSGRFDGALAAAREARDTAAAYTMETVAASADLAAATVLAIRGEPPQPLLASALASVDEAEYRASAARARHAAGLAALACGDYQGAYAQLSQLFGADGTPLHHHVSYLGLADLAAAAVRADRAPATRPLVERALARLDPAPGPRVDLLAARARGLLAEPGEAGAQLGHDGPAHWPFERAQLRLDYGEWLRRQRRINDAKPVLAEALEVFGRLGATPWQRRAEAELRACGVTTRAEPGTLAGLTAQQREIVVLASRGLTNGEIADRLFLSPRTVASHLYRSYPKLGIAGRHQLRDLVEADG